MPRCFGASGSVRAASQTCVARWAGRGIDLLPVHHILVAVADRPRLHRCEVGPGVRLGVADRELDLAAQHAWEDVALLLLGAVPHDRRAYGDVCERVERHPLERHFLGQHPEVERTLALAAVLLRPGDCGEALVGHRLHELLRGRPVAVDVVRRDLGLELGVAVAIDEVAHTVAELDHLRRHLEVHASLLRPGRLRHPERAPRRDSRRTTEAARDFGAARGVAGRYGPQTSGRRYPSDWRAEVVEIRLTPAAIELAQRRGGVMALDFIPPLG